MEGIKTNIKKIGDTWKPYKNEAQNKTSQTDSKAINSYPDNKCRRTGNRKRTKLEGDECRYEVE